jgi:hypothetical protein
MHNGATAANRSHIRSMSQSAGQRRRGLARRQQKWGPNGTGAKIRTHSSKGRVVELKVPIGICVEQTDEVIDGTALLDLASGEIVKVEYKDWDVARRGLPWDSADYEFTSGTLTHQGKDVEFSVELNKTTGQFSVNANELLEIKLKAAQLFAGMTGADVLANATGRKH